MGGGIPGDNDMIFVLIDILNPGGGVLFEIGNGNDSGHSTFYSTTFGTLVNYKIFTPRMISRI